MLPFQGHVNTSFSQAELVGLSIYVQRKHVLFELDWIVIYVSNFYVLKWTNTNGSELSIIKHSTSNKVLLT